MDKKHFYMGDKFRLKYVRDGILYNEIFMLVERFNADHPFYVTPITGHIAGHITAAITRGDKCGMYGISRDHLISELLRMVVKNKEDITFLEDAEIFKDGLLS